jgi:hypothetical protein
VADTRRKKISLLIALDPGVLARVDERAVLLGLERSDAIELLLDEAIGRLSIREREDALYAIEAT